MPKRSSPDARPTDPARYRRTLESLYRRRRFGIAPGLEVIGALLAHLGDPQRRFPSVHVTGSKGKGSVAAMAQAVLTRHGRRTGLFTSPHLVSYRERMQIDGRPIDPDALVATVERVEEAAGSLERSGGISRPPTFFEITTAAAFDWFARERVAAAVVEVGIGGRLDATNVLASRVGVVTTVELEHTDILGSTVEAIAREKAGIFHDGMTGVIGELPPGATAEVESVAARLGVGLWRLGAEVRVLDRTLDERGQTFSLHAPGHSLEGLEVPLQGRFQPGNAALAVAAFLRFAAATGLAPDERRVRAALAAVRWPGRLERVARRPDLYYDVAHTPESARAVQQSLGEIYPMGDPGENAIVFGCLRGKNVPAILDALAPLARTFLAVPVRSERGVPLTELKALAAGRFARIVLARSAAEGERLARAATGPEGFTLVVGSDYLIGELLRAARAEHDDEPDLSDPGTGAYPSPAPAGEVARPPAQRSRA
jgi:dihydrofolate synthase / folylpolyglutamate synthase